jgi:hypothetical protein
MEIMKSMKKQEPGGCIIDGLTLQNALDVLIPQHRSKLANTSGSFEALRHSKDETTKNIYPIQLTSLAQFIEALVCHERVLTPLANASILSTHPELQAVLDKNIVRFIDIPPILSEQLETYAEKRIIKLATSKVFQNFVDNLTENTVESILLKIARHYHGLESKAYVYLRENDKISNIDKICHQIFSKWSEKGKSALSHAVAIFGTGAFFYQSLATVLQVPYSPFCLRTPFCVYDDTTYGNAPHSGATLALRIIKNEAYNTLSATIPTNSPFSLMEFEAPPIFAMVLRRAKNRLDILPAAVQLRESKVAKKYRDDVTRLTDALNKGNSPEILKLIDKIKGSVKNALKTDDVNQNVKLKIGFVLGSIEFSLPLKSVAVLNEIFCKAKRTTFYFTILSEMPIMSNLSSDIERLFGQFIDRAILREMEKYS